MIQESTEMHVVEDLDSVCTTSCYFLHTANTTTQFHESKQENEVCRTYSPPLYYPKRNCRLLEW